MSETWGPRARPEHDDWPAQDLKRRRLAIERDLIVYSIVGAAIGLLIVRFHYWDAIVRWLAR